MPLPYVCFILLISLKREVFCKIQIKVNPIIDNAIDHEINNTWRLKGWISKQWEIEWKIDAWSMLLKSANFCFIYVYEYEYVCNCARVMKFKGNIAQGKHTQFTQIFNISKTPCAKIVNWVHKWNFYSTYRFRYR